MIDLAKKFSGGFFALSLVLIFGLQGCIQVGAPSAGVCSGTECGTHDESNNSVDNSNNENQNAVY